MSTTQTIEQAKSYYYSLVTKSLEELNQGDGATHYFLCKVFHYTCLCHDKKIDPVESLTEEEQNQFVEGLLQALPTMDENLRRLVARFGDECLDEGRYTKSGYYFLRDDFLPKLNVSQETREIIKKGLDEFAAGENFEDLSEMIDMCKNGGNLPFTGDDPTLDLRGVPASHDWYAEYERKRSRVVYGE